MKRFGQRFLNRVYTAAEQAYCLRKRNSAESLAARFAAKEAAAKALGTGISRGVNWLEIEVVREPGGRPIHPLSRPRCGDRRANGVLRTSRSRLRIPQASPWPALFLKTTLDNRLREVASQDGAEHQSKLLLRMLGPWPMRPESNQPPSERIRSVTPALSAILKAIRTSRPRTVESNFIEETPCRAAKRFSGPS